MYKYILSFISLLVVTGCGGDSDSPTNSNVELEYSDHVSVTGNQACSVIGKELQCSGSNWMGGSLIPLPTPPVSESVELVSVGHNHACEIAGNEVKCWGDNSNGELNVPFLSKSYLIACGESFSCAADSAGLDCWGYQGGSFCIDSLCSSWIVISDPTSNPELRNITDLSVSNLYGCAITNGQVKCWGHASYGQTSAPALDNAIQITTGDFHACALTTSGTNCWGYGDLNKNKPQDFLPTLISAGQGFTCGIDNNSVQCWGEANVTGSIYEAPILEHSLSNPTSVSAGSDLVCVIDDNGRACFGDTSLL